MSEIMVKKEFEQFISEPIKPVKSTFDTSRMAVGEPGLPQEFSWRGKTYRIKKVLETGKKLGPCRHGSGEMYVRKHFYKVETESGEIMTLYFDRQMKTKKARWWLLSSAESYKKDSSGF